MSRFNTRHWISSAGHTAASAMNAAARRSSADRRSHRARPNLCHVAAVSRCATMGFTGAGAIVRYVVPILSALSTPAGADYRITRDHGGLVESYKTKYAKIRERGERVIIDGICNSACTLVLGIVPLSRVCVTPNASLGFHQAYFDKSYTFGVKLRLALGVTQTRLSGTMPSTRSEEHTSELQSRG